MVDSAVKGISRSWAMRSWKREIASLLLVVWSIITLRLFCFPASDTFIAAVVGLYSIATPAVFTFAIGAFGFDAYIKQVRSPAQQAETSGGSSPPVLKGAPA